MTVKECYAAMGGDYEDVMHRLLTEERVKRFVLRFPADTSYALILGAFEEKNAQEAFRGAHTLKGVAQNLSFTKLYESSHALTEDLRPGCFTEESEALLEQVTEDYSQALAAIEGLSEKE